MIIPMSQRKANPKPFKPIYTDMECRMDNCTNRVMSAVRVSKVCDDCVKAKGLAYQNKINAHYRVLRGGPAVRPKITRLNRHTIQSMTPRQMAECDLGQYERRVAWL